MPEETEGEELLKEMEREAAAVKIQSVHWGNAARTKLESRLSRKQTSRNESLLKGPDAPAPVQFYRYVLNHGVVATTVMGLRNGDLFEEVAAGLCERVTLSREEQYALETYGAERRAAGALE